MFEYLMPLLVMPTYENTLLDQTYRAVVRRQISYGRQRGVPWGMSESGYNTIDLHMNYQYRAFGVPGLGLKRGLAEDLVVAPYASVLALMVAPEGGVPEPGTTGRRRAAEAPTACTRPSTTRRRGCRAERRSVTVRQFMAHHEGMSLLALAYVLLDRPMQRRFEADPMLRAADLLAPGARAQGMRPIFPHVAEAARQRSTSAEEEGTMRVFTDPGGAVPEVHLLSNGRYHVVITSAGGGYSRWRDLAVTRWREDPTRDCWGSFCYLRDLDSGIFWSTAWQPTLKPAKRYQAIFTQGRAEFRRATTDRHAHRDQRLARGRHRAAADHDHEPVRRASDHRGDQLCRGGPGPAAHDLAHPAFSNLFVQTELVRNRQAILCTRRPRSAEERPPWLVHLMTVQGTTVGEASFETDRMRFIGRGTNPRPLPAATGRQSGRSPTARGRCSIPSSASATSSVLQPNETVRVDLVTGVAESREAVTALMEKYSRPPAGGPGLRTGLDAQPILAAATQRHRGRCPGLWPAGGLDHLRLAHCAGRRPAC